MQLLNYSEAQLCKFFRLSILCSALVLSLNLSSCDTNKPKELIPQSKFVIIMTDLHLIDGYVSTLMYNDSSKVNKQSLYRSVYAKHKISPAVYDLSLKYYSRDPKLLDSLYVQVEKRLSKFQQINTPKPVNDIPK